MVGWPSSRLLRRQARSDARGRLRLGHVWHGGRVAALRLLRVAVRGHLWWSDEHEEDGQKQEAVCNAKDGDGEELLEEDAEDVALRGGEDEDGEEGGEGAVDDGGAHLADSGLHPLCVRALCDDKRVRNVRRVVDCEADGEDEVDDGDRVDGEAPHLHHAEDAHVGEQHAEHHEQRGAQLGEDEQHDDKDRGDGEPEVGEHLPLDDLVLLVVEVLEAVRVGALDRDRGYTRAERVHRIDLVGSLSERELRGAQPRRRQALARRCRVDPQHVPRESAPLRRSHKLIEPAVVVGGREERVRQRGGRAARGRLQAGASLCGPSPGQQGALEGDK
mmetsp:Transcript_41856/g.135345  ORF Transcript_41856/g.135345 Transcript_41856/m.135345 type:complete len:331 (-) Transcript_41856:2035-3027(-)